MLTQLQLPERECQHGHECRSLPHPVCSTDEAPLPPPLTLALMWAGVWGGGSDAVLGGPTPRHGLPQFPRLDGGWRLGAGGDVLCDPGQIPLSLWALVFPSVQWEANGNDTGPIALP